MLERLFLLSTAGLFIPATAVAQVPHRLVEFAAPARNAASPSARVLSSGVKVHEFRPREPVAVAPQTPSSVPPPPFSGNQVKLPSLLVPKDQQSSSQTVGADRRVVEIQPSSEDAPNTGRDRVKTSTGVRVPAFHKGGNAITPLTPKTIEFRQESQRSDLNPVPADRPLPSFESPTNTIPALIPDAPPTIPSLPSFTRPAPDQGDQPAEVLPNSPVDAEQDEVQIPAPVDKPQRQIEPSSLEPPTGPGGAGVIDSAPSLIETEQSIEAPSISRGSAEFNPWGPSQKPAPAAAIDPALPYAAQVPNGNPTFNDSGSEAGAGTSSLPTASPESADFGVDDRRAAWRYAWQTQPPTESAISSDSLPVPTGELSAAIGLQGPAPPTTNASPFGVHGSRLRRGESPFGSEVMWGDEPRFLSGVDYHWTAPGTYHQPLYFEDVNLERAGHSWGVIQPTLSAAHFFGRIPALPYLLAAHPPFECVYTLGHYRPGSCAPHLRRWPRIKSLGALTQGGVATGLVFLVP